MRIGVVAAKALAYAWQIPVASVNTLQVIAQAAAENQPADRRGKPLEEWRICPAVNAQRGQLFVGQFKVSKDEKGLVTESAVPMSIVSRGPWLEEMTELSATKQPLLTGMGIKPIKGEIEKRALSFCEHSISQPNVEVVAQLGRRQFERGDREDFLKIQPLYFRPSAAEEKRQSKKQESSE